MNSGPIRVVTLCDDKTDTNYGNEVDIKTYKGPTKQVLKDLRKGYHTMLGHTSKSSMYDILGYADRDTEKLYACWVKENNKAVVKASIQNIDIYDSLYNI